MGNGKKIVKAERMVVVCSICNPVEWDFSDDVFELGVYFVNGYKTIESISRHKLKDLDDFFERHRHGRGTRVTEGESELLLGGHCNFRIEYREK